VKLLLALATLAVSLALPGVASADEIKTTIQEALEAYEGGDLVTAKESLGYATQLISQKNASKLGTILPQALAGWTARDAESDAGAASIFGGGIQASRSYTKEKSRLSIQIMGDSPMLAQWIPMMSNPAMGAAMGKTIRIGKQRAIQGKDGKLVMVVANRFLITIEGNASAEDKTEYAKAIDLEALQSL
jgi:hypothetical protein